MNPKGNYHKPAFLPQKAAKKINKPQQARTSPINLRSFPLESSVPVNVIIAAYQAEHFIEKCLKSIAQQTKAPVRILVGVDGCLPTLIRLNEIKWQFENLEIYYSKENNGPYMMRNALISLLNEEDYFLLFDADDEMYPRMLEIVTIDNISKQVCGDGILFSQKRIFSILGGYKPWRCAADTEFNHRLERIASFKKIASNSLFYRRKHPNQLTSNPETNYTSLLRAYYRQEISALSRENIIQIPCEKSIIVKVE